VPTRSSSPIWTGGGRVGAQSGVRVVGLHAHPRGASSRFETEAALYLTPRPRRLPPAGRRRLTPPPSAPLRGIRSRAVATRRRTASRRRCSRRSPAERSRCSARTGATPPSPPWPTARGRRDGDYASRREGRHLSRSGGGNQDARRRGTRDGTVFRFVVEGTIES
jgi:hypothetical protein